MRIQHNVMAMNAYRNYSNNVSAMKANLEKLSSGYKINRAGDDAAGLAISEKMRAQITGLETAQKNAKDGISLVQTAEGALTEVHDMLNRMVELATQSANGTYDNDTDRAQLQKEMDQLRAEINRIADSSNFNGIKLLDGSMDAEGISATYENMSTDDIIKLLLPEGKDQSQVSLGAETQLEASAADNDGRPAASIELDGMKHTVQDADNDRITITVGDQKLEMKQTFSALGFKANQELNGEDIAKAFAGSTITLDGLEYTAKVDGSRVILDPTDPTQVKGQVNAHYDVKVEGAGVSTDTPAGEETKGVYSYQVTTKFADGDTLEIGGKTIKFAAGKAADAVDGADANTIYLDDLKADDIANQVGAIIEKFKGDSTWEVKLKSGTTDTVEFTQKTADVNNTLTAVATGSGTATGVITEVKKISDATDGVGGTFKAQITTNLTSDAQITIDGTTLVAGTDFKVGADAAETAGNIAQALAENGTKNYNVSSSGDLLVFTEKVPDTTNTTGPTVTVSKTPAALDAVELTGSDESGWTLKLDPSQLTADDTLKFGNNTFTAKSSSASGNNQFNTSDSLSDIATKMAAVLTDFNVTAEGDSLKITQKTAGTGTLGDFIYAATGSPTGGAVGTVSQALPAEAKKPETSGFQITTPFAEGDQITLTDGQGRTFDIRFGNAAAAAADSNTIDISSATDITSQMTAIQTFLTNTGKDLGDEASFVVKCDGNAITIEQKEAGVGDTTAITATVSKASSGKGAVTEDTAAVSNEKAPEATTGSFNVGTVDIRLNTSGTGDRLANTVVDLTGKLTDGSKIKLGTEEYVIAVGDKSAFANAANAVKVGENDTEEVIASKLTEAAAKNSTFSVGHITNTAKISLQQLTSAKDKTDMETMEKLASYIGVSTVKAGTEATAGRGLTLQIADTADDYNQLKVNIKDMHATSMGIDGISIADQESAAAAVDAIKSAINYVSDVRGTLGATQNRLDHTINNLSVMTENIQDAESTIRDVDVAEEMMAYTKNNILIQSAQAMLAQANQVPQGVLQLLG